MINDLYENDLGLMAGTFFSELLGYDVEAAGIQEGI